MRYTILWSLIVSSTTGLLFSPEPSRAQTAPEGAVRAAQKYLEQSISATKHDKQLFAQHWRTDKVDRPSDMRLGEPYCIYIMNAEHILEYSTAMNDDPAAHADVLAWAFPIFFEHSYVATIKVTSSDGEWRFLGMHYAEFNDFEPWLFRLREKFSRREGYVVSKLRTWGLGTFLLIHRNGQLSSVAPTIGISAKILSSTEGPNHTYPLTPANDAVTKLKAAARQVRDRVERESRDGG